LLYLWPFISPLKALGLKTQVVQYFLKIINFAQFMPYLQVQSKILQADFYDFLSAEKIYTPFKLRLV